MGKKNEEERLSAYHEAAHVVARYRFQIGEVTYSTIKSGTQGYEASTGYTEAAWKTEGDAELTEEETIAAYREMERTPEHIVLTLAGPAAEYVISVGPIVSMTTSCPNIWKPNPRAGHLPTRCKRTDYSRPMTKRKR